MTEGFKYPYMFLQYKTSSNNKVEIRILFAQKDSRKPGFKILYCHTNDNRLSLFEAQTEEMKRLFSRTLEMHYSLKILIRFLYLILISAHYFYKIDCARVKTFKRKANQIFRLVIFTPMQSGLSVTLSSFDET